MRSLVISRVVLLGVTLVSFTAPVNAQCLPLICGFSEKGGVKGPYIKAAVDEQKLATADAVISKGRLDGTLAAGSIDKGELFGTGLAMPVTERALEKMLESLRPHWPHRQPGQIKVKIVGSFTFSPLAHADNVIVVPLGMLIKAQSDDQVAWLLAHEFSHLALAHFARQTKGRKRERVISTAITLLQGGAVMANSRYRFQKGNLTSEVKDQKATDAAISGIFFKSEKLRGFLSLVNNFFSRKQEDQADVAGIDLAYAAGYSDAGASLAIEELGYEDAARKGLLQEISNGLKNYARTEALQTLAAAGTDDTTLKAKGKSIFNDILGNAAEVGLSKLTEHYGATHRPTVARRKGVVSYFEKTYPMGELREPKTTWLNGARATAEFKAGNLVVDAEVRARDFLNKGEFQSASRELLPALKSRFGQTPLVLNTAAQVAVASGQLVQAEKYYSAAMKREANPENPYIGQSIKGFVEHVDLLIAMKNLRRADEVITVAASRFGDDQVFLPQRVQIALARKDLEQIAAVLARCNQTEDQALIAQCRSALIGEEAKVGYENLTPIQKAQLDKQLGLLQQQSQAKGFWDTLGKALEGKDVE